MEPWPVDVEPKSSFSRRLARPVQLQGAVMFATSRLPKGPVPALLFLLSKHPLVREQRRLSLVSANFFLLEALWGAGRETASVLLFKW